MSYDKTQTAVLAIDPGIGTGWAIVAEGAILGTGVLTPEEVETHLDAIIRGMHRAGYSLIVVVERMPAIGKLGSLAGRLNQVLFSIRKVVEQTFELTIHEVAPGEWKPSRVSRKTRVPLTFGGKKLVTHQRDAIRMALYFVEKEKTRAE